MRYTYQTDNINEFINPYYLVNISPVEGYIGTLVGSGNVSYLD